MKIATPLEKSHPLSPSNPPLKVEVLSSTHFLKIWLEAQPPPPSPAERGGGAHYGAVPGGTTFLSKILVLLDSMQYLCMVKKAKWFFDGKKFNFSK